MATLAFHREPCLLPDVSRRTEMLSNHNNSKKNTQNDNNKAADVANTGTAQMIIRCEMTRLDGRLDVERGVGGAWRHDHRASGASGADSWLQPGLALSREFVLNQQTCFQMNFSNLLYLIMKEGLSLI